ncbi:MAG: RNA-binding transcriptional accessory protein [Bacteriovoracaceae bacterium]|nr:RNA-binding transcriptional accessory protein [Bacteriovoracaceae bacterium]
MDIDQQAVNFSSKHTNTSLNQTSSVLNLLINEGCTVPFITRYRKEATGGLDEVQIRAIQDSYDQYLEREKRRTYIIDTIGKMEKMTPELLKQIQNCKTINQLEDIYAPYKSKKKTKGVIAKEAGLEPLANILLNSMQKLEEIKNKHLSEFLNPALNINSFEDAVNGACNIIIERMTHTPKIKEQLRIDYWNEAQLVSIKKEKIQDIKDSHKYKDYFNFNEPIKMLKSPKKSHRFLAIKRAMTQKILKVDVAFPEESAIPYICAKFIKQGSALSDLLTNCAQKAYRNYIHPSLDLEIKAELKNCGDESAIDVFGKNLKTLLLSPYLGAKSVLGIDPGVRTGCKIAVIDNTGKFIIDTVIYPHPPQNDISKSAMMIETLLEKFNVIHIAIGNGTYGRETLAFIEKNIKQVKSKEVKATLVSESGASIYSTSELARKEFPDKDPTVRGAISIARRFQDPLAELVKIDPKSIGVGQYQHDVNQSKLKKSLSAVVEGCVNYVGVDLNTASAPLLAYISGVGPTLAKNIVKFREKNGHFKDRQELLKVSRFSAKVFEQSAGFLRIYNGTTPLDSTFIHPEQYHHISLWAKNQNMKLAKLCQEPSIIDQLERDNHFKNLVGAYTHQDIIKALKAPVQDPRVEFKSTEFRKDISQMSDLKEGQWYPGVVTNITQFGAFVDIGIKENGLLHISQISDSFVENALDALNIGQALKVKVISLDFERKRIALSCKSDELPVPKTPRNDKVKSTKTKPQKNKQKKNNPFACLKDLKLK